MLELTSFIFCAILLSNHYFLLDFFLKILLLLSKHLLGLAQFVNGLLRRRAWTRAVFPLWARAGARFTRSPLKQLCNFTHSGFFLWSALYLPGLFYPATIILLTALESWHSWPSTFQIQLQTATHLSDVNGRVRTIATCFLIDFFLTEQELLSCVMGPQTVKLWFHVKYFLHVNWFLFKQSTHTEF